jgi:glycosyltransferase involved in cell wall biosynthesis
MKTLLVHNRYLQRGGEDEAFASESALLLANGHEVVEYLQDNRDIGRLGRGRTAARTLWSRQAERRLRRLLERHRPEVAHFHNTFPLISPSAYYACRQTGTPVVQTLHNYRLLCAAATLFREGRVCEECIGRTIPWPGLWHRCYHRSAPQSAVVTAMLVLHLLLGTWQRQVDLYIALSEFARRKLIQGGLPPGRIVVKPNFLQLDPGAGSGEGSYALFAGRLSPEKGVGPLLRAWRMLPRIPLLLAGEGPLLQRARRQADSLGGVEVLGRCPRDELFRLMKGARFLVFPSLWYESSPMVIVESFACGLPVLAACQGAAAEIVEHGRTGLLVPPGDAKRLAEAAAWLWSRPAEARRMGREARAEFEAKYSAQRNYARLMEIYQTARGMGRGRPV